MIFFLIRSIPFDENTLLGWIGLSVFGTSAAGINFAINVCFLSYYIVVCLHYRAFRVHFKEILGEIDRELAKSQYSNRVLKCILAEAVEYHTLLKR